MAYHPDNQGPAGQGRWWACIGCAALVLVLCGAAQAAPAPWYWWVSKLNGQRVCAQHLPAHGWERAEGPFAQAGCTVRRPQPSLGTPR